MRYFNRSVESLENKPWHRFFIRKENKAGVLTRRRGVGPGSNKDTGLWMFVFFVNTLFLIMLIQVLQFF